MRDVERLRGALNLDPAEIAPEPLAVAGRFSRRFRLDLVAAVAARAVAGRSTRSRRTRLRPAAANGLAWGRSSSGWLTAVVPLGASPGAADGRGRAPRRPALRRRLPSANAAGTLREGEVVPVLDASGDWLQVEDNAGARGWAHDADVRRLDGAPATPSQG